MKRKEQTSWNRVKNWYSKSQDHKGDFFHRELILPNLLRLMQLQKKDTLLDLACGEGILSRAIPPISQYVGVDIAPGLIVEAKEKNTNKFAVFYVGDVSEPLQIHDKNFTHASIVLALQNIQDPEGVFANAAENLASKGKLFIVLNHPYFRIPKATAWMEDYRNNVQFRRVDKYMTPHKIPIDMTPGRTSSKEITVSFHYPLSFYIEYLSKAGFVISNIEKWISPKKSEGKYATMENIARNEFPMFMCIVAEKVS
jgi:ubiquinone/menaquinone biosynthesis C-methylase UbiE